MSGKVENALKGMGHYREVGWGWGKGLMSLASASDINPFHAGGDTPRSTLRVRSRLGGSATG